MLPNGFGHTRFPPVINIHVETPTTDQCRGGQAHLTVKNKTFDLILSGSQILLFVTELGVRVRNNVKLSTMHTKLHRSPVLDSLDGDLDWK